jgi:hypothetical protein
MVRAFMDQKGRAASRERIKAAAGRGLTFTLKPVEKREGW